MTDLVSRVARRYSAVIDQRSLDKWAKDLRLMTKIYRDIPVSYQWDDEAERDKCYGRFREAEKLFKVFSNGFEEWIYKVVLPKMSKEEGYLVKELRTSAWNFLHSIRILFPIRWDGVDSKNTTYIPSLDELKRDREKNVKRYQVAFTKVYKQLEAYLEQVGGSIVRYDAVDHLEVAGVPVILENLGRKEDGEDYAVEPLNLLGKHLKTVRQAGFGAALDGVSVTMNFESKDLTSGRYSPAKDVLTLYPLGMVHASDGHTLIHEIGHRFWFKCLPGQAIALWEQVLGDRGTKITKGDVEYFFKVVKDKLKREDHYLDSDDILRLALPAARSEADELKFRELAETGIKGIMVTPDEPFDPDDYLRRLMFNDGEVVQVEEISDYGDTEPVEGFAEAFRLWVTKGPRAFGPFTRELFIKVCRAGGARI